MDLKYYLFEKSIPVKEFAKLLGVSASLIYHILKQQRMPSRTLATKIEQLTKGAVTKEELLFPDQTSVRKWTFNEGRVQERLEDCEERLSKLEKIVDSSSYLKD